MFSAFKNYLAGKALVQNKYVSYYLKWVANCYVFLGEPQSVGLSHNDRERFLKHLANSCEDWQVNQADNALRAYEFSLSSNHRSTTAKEMWAARGQL